MPGIFSLSYFDQCANENDLGNIEFIDENDKRLFTIIPNVININEIKNYHIYLNLNNSNNSIDDKPLGIKLIEKNTEQEINKLFLTRVENNKNNIYFDIELVDLSKINPGNYYIKLIYFQNEQNIKSTETLLFVDRLSLYTKKQTIVKSDKLNKIGVIFSDIISETQISKITYNETKLNIQTYNNSDNNILLIDTSNINLNETGNYTFEIYENNVNEPLFYTLETINKTESESDIIFNHYINTKSNNGYTFIIISVTDDVKSINYTINDSTNTITSITQIWDNTFVG